MEKERIPQERISEQTAEVLETKISKEKEQEPVFIEKTKREEVKDPIREMKTPMVSTPPPTKPQKINKLAPTQQVEALVSVALEKGLKKAIALAQEIDNPAVLDDLHDALVDQCYQELIDKKIIKP